MDTNFVLAGKHEGCAIKTDNEIKEELTGLNKIITCY